MGLLKDFSELNVAIVSGNLQAELQAGGSLTDLNQIVKEATASGKLKLEIGSVSSLDGDVILYKSDDVSDENKELYFKTLKASTDYRLGILNAMKDAGDALIELAK